MDMSFPLKSAHTLSNAIAARSSASSHGCKDDKLSPIKHSRKRVAILITGQIRTNRNQYHTFRDTCIDNVLNDENKKDCELNVFFSVDNSAGEDLKISDSVRSIVEVDKESNHVPCQFSVDLDLLESNYMEHYRNRINNIDASNMFQNTPPRAQQVQRFYKVYRAYLSMLEYEEQKGMKHDFIFVTRADAVFYRKIIFDELLNNYTLLVCWDHVFLGERNIMSHYCKLVFDYGKYNLGEIIHKDVDRVIHNGQQAAGRDYYTYGHEWPNWSESPEVQTTEHLFDYINRNCVDMEKVNSSILRECCWFLGA